MQDSEPDLPKKQMKPTSGRVSQQIGHKVDRRPGKGGLFLLGDHRPTFVMGNCSHKEYALAKFLAFPNSLPWAEMSRTNKKSFISLFCRVPGSRGELSNMCVFYVRLQLHIIEELPKL